VFFGRYIFPVEEFKDEHFQTKEFLLTDAENLNVVGTLDVDLEIRFDYL